MRRTQAQSFGIAAIAPLLATCVMVARDQPAVVAAAPVSAPALDYAQIGLAEPDDAAPASRETAATAVDRDMPVPIEAPLHLHPGRSVWLAGSQARGGAVGVLVDLRRQMAYVYRDATLIGVSTVSTGRRGYATPTGRFPILEKAAWHRSTLYSDAPMPFMQRLTWGGVALHAGGVPGYRQSHGCIHLPRAFARTLFGLTAIGSMVEIVGAAPAGQRAAAPAVLVARAAIPTTAESASAVLDSAL